jgi:hypothetical protein
MRSDDHSPDQNAGTGIPTHTHNTVEKGMVLPGYGNLKPVPIFKHTRFRIYTVLPVPMSCLIDRFTVDMQMLKKDCVTCTEAKQSQEPFSKSTE